MCVREGVVTKAGQTHYAVGSVFVSELAGFWFLFFLDYTKSETEMTTSVTGKNPK